jgi:uncharacterized RDD family membrane protein YckC
MKMQASKGFLGQYAGFFTRLVAFLIDVFILVAATSLITVTITAVLKLFGIDIQQCVNLNKGIDLKFVLCSVSAISLVVINVSLVPLYFIFFWSLSGQTLGDAAMGVRVVRINGRRMTAGIAILRYIGFILSLLALGLGFAWILVDDRRQGWHDKMAGTCVIYSWEARMDERFLWRIIKRVQHRWGSQGEKQEVVMDVTSAMRKYRIAVFNLDKTTEAYDVFDVLKRVDREDSSRVLSVTVVQKDHQGQLNVTDATESLEIKTPFQPDQQVLDLRLRAILENIPRNRSSVVAVIDQDYVDDVSDALPQCEVAVFRVDITPEYTRVQAPEDSGENQPAATEKAG